MMAQLLEVLKKEIQALSSEEQGKWLESIAQFVHGGKMPAKEHIKKLKRENISEAEFADKVFGTMSFAESKEIETMMQPIDSFPKLVHLANKLKTGEISIDLSESQRKTFKVFKANANIASNDEGNPFTKMINKLSFKKCFSIKRIRKT